MVRVHERLTKTLAIQSTQYTAPSESESTMAISDKQRQAVLDHLEHGLSLRQACKSADINRPSDILDCVNPEHTRYMPEYAVQYMRVRAISYQLLGDDLLTVSDDENIEPNSRRIMVDSRKWMLARMLPKVYGDKTDVNLTGKLEYAHTGPVSDATQSIIAQITAGSDKPSNEGTVPD